MLAWTTLGLAAVEQLTILYPVPLNPVYTQFAEPSSLMKPNYHIDTLPLKYYFSSSIQW